MPVQIKCNQCGKILDQCSFEEFEKSSYLSSIREKYNRKCPNCDHQLSSRPLNIEVKVKKEAKRSPEIKRKEKTRERLFTSISQLKW